MSQPKQLRIYLSEDASSALLAFHEKCGFDKPVTHLVNMIVLSATQGVKFNDMPVAADGEQYDTIKYKPA